MFRILKYSRCGKIKGPSLPYLDMSISKTAFMSCYYGISTVDFKYNCSLLPYMDEDHILSSEEYCRRKFTTKLKYID